MNNSFEQPLNFQHILTHLKDFSHSLELSNFIVQAVERKNTCLLWDMNKGEVLGLDGLSRYFPLPKEVEHPCDANIFLSLFRNEDQWMIAQFLQDNNNEQGSTNMMCCLSQGQEEVYFRIFLQWFPEIEILGFEFKMTSAHPFQLKDQQKDERALLLHKKLSLEICSEIKVGGFWLQVGEELGWCSPTVYTILGLDDRSVAPTVQNFMEYLHPRFRQTLSTKFLSLEHGKFYHFEIQLRHKVYGYRWVAFGVKREKVGQETYLIGYFKDIHEEHSKKALADQQEHQLSTTKQRIYELKDSLSEMKYRLSNREQELDQLIYRIAHNLRAPVATQKGLISILKLGVSPQELTDLMERMENNAEQMDQFIFQIMQYLNMTKDNQRFVRQIDVRQMVMDILNKVHESQLYPLVKISRVTGNFPLPIFVGNEAKVAVIFENLIANAFKFADVLGDSQSVTVHLDISEKGLSAKVIDNGQGIHRNEIPNIFTMFYRGLQPKISNGLGLFVVKNAVEDLGGWVSVESELKVGSTFSIFIPQKKVQSL